MPKISIVVPCYNEQDVLPLFYQEITRVSDEMREAEFEYVFVDDGSKDQTLPLLRELAAQDGRVRFVSLSRNFGKEAGILAGLEAATGDYVALMDADLQDPPALLPALYRAVTEEGYDCAATRRATREGEPPVRSAFARLFYRLINRISDADIVDGARDYRLMRRSMVDAILSMREYSRFSKGIFGWVGFRVKWFSYPNVERAAGETKWSFWKLFRYAVEGILAFSTAPLLLAAGLGLLLCLSAFGLLAVAAARGSAEGWLGLLCAVLFLGGIELLCMGILGQYLAKTYLEIKKRPVYLVRETEAGIK